MEIYLIRSRVYAISYIRRREPNINRACAFELLERTRKVSHVHYNGHFPVRGNRHFLFAPFRWSTAYFLVAVAGNILPSTGDYRIADDRWRHITAGDLDGTLTYPGIPWHTLAYPLCRTLPAHNRSLPKGKERNTMNETTKMDRAMKIEALRTMLTAPNKNVGISKNDVYEEVRNNYLNFLAAQSFPGADNKLKFVENFLDEERFVLHDTFVELAFMELLRGGVDLSGLKWDDPDVYEIVYQQVLRPADIDFLRASVKDDKTLAHLEFKMPDHGPYEFLKRHANIRLRNRFVNLRPVRFTVKVLTKIKTFIKGLVKAFKEMPGKIRGFLADMFEHRLVRGKEPPVEVVLDILSSVAIGYGVGALAKMACEKFGVTIVELSTVGFCSPVTLVAAITTPGWIVMLAVMAITGLLTTILHDLAVNLQYYEYCKRCKIKYSWLPVSGKPKTGTGDVKPIK